MQRPATQQMDMEVRYALAAIFPIVNDESETLGQIQLDRGRGRRQQQVTEQGLVGSRGFLDPGDWFFGYDQNVNGCLGMNVMECDAHVVLMFDASRNFAIDDALEQRFAHGGERKGTAGVDNNQGFD